MVEATEKGEEEEITRVKKRERIDTEGGGGRGTEY